MTYDPQRVVGPPCGCHTIGACIHRDPTIRQTEDLDMSCPIGAVLCSTLGIAERDAAAEAHVCCAQLVVMSS